MSGKATQVHIKERSRCYLGSTKLKVVLVLLTLCSSRLDKTIAFWSGSTWQALSRNPRERSASGVSHRVLDAVLSLCLSFHAFPTPGALKASALPTPSTKAFGI